MKAYYEDSAVTIWHGDCREILPMLAQFDLLLTDPPYGLDGHAHRGPISWTNQARGNDYGAVLWDKHPASKDDMELMRGKSELQIIWGGNFFDLPASRGWLVWDKQNTGDFGDCELAWTNLEQPIRIFHHLWNGMIKGSERGTRRVHPTQKPTELMRWCLNFVPNASTILDPFMGSGTTLRAAKDLGRKAIGIEIEERYCEIAARRMAQEVLNFA